MGCLRSLRAHLALDGVSWVQSGSVEIAVGQTDRMLQNRRRHLLPPSGVAPLGSSVRSPLRLRLLGYAGSNSVPCRNMACDNGKTAVECDARLAHRGSFRDREGLVFEFQRPLVARQHDIGGFVEERANAAIAALGDATGVINLA